MKTIYQKPETLVVAMMHRESMLEGSLEDPTEERLTGGGPRNPEDGGIAIPWVIQKTSTTTDPFVGKGQGSNGTGNRAKSWAWDDEY